MEILYASIRRKRRFGSNTVVPLVVPSLVAKTSKILDAMRREPRQIRFADLYKVCVEFFGEPRQSGSSHVLFKTPWPGDPRINIQNDNGRAKAYQVRQVLLAIDKLKELEHEARVEQDPED